METFFRSLSIVLLACALLVVQSTVALLIPIHPFEPNLLLPIVIFLGVAQEVQIVRGVAMAISAVVFVAGGSLALHRALKRAGVLEGFPD